MLTRLVTSNTIRLTRLFSKNTRMSTTPQIFKDPNFTRTGYRNASVKRKQHNLEGVPNAHLYYDKKVDDKITKKDKRRVEIAHRFEPPVEDYSIAAIVQDLTNFDLVTRGSLD